MKRMIFLLLVASSVARAHHQEQPASEFVGEGTIKSDPDFISLAITVRADCQARPKAAQDAVDTVVAEIDSFLQGLKPKSDDEHFKILINGGFTEPYSVWRNNQEVCRNTFQKTTTITFKIGHGDDFSDTFSKIQSFVLHKYQQASNLGERDVPRTYVTVSTPVPELTREHRLLLEKSALDLAVRDAKENFKSAIKSCEDHRWKVQSIKEGGSGYKTFSPVRFYAKASPRSESADAARDVVAPVRFDELEITKTVTVAFQFEGALCFDK